MLLLIASVIVSLVIDELLSEAAFKLKAAGVRAYTTIMLVLMIDILLAYIAC